MAGPVVVADLAAAVVVQVVAGPAAAVLPAAKAVVVAVRPEVGAAEPVNSSQSSGASRICGAPFFC